MSRHTRRRTYTSRAQRREGNYTHARGWMCKCTKISKREREEERTRVHKKYWHTPDTRMARRVGEANLLPLLPVVISKYYTSRTDQLIRRVSGLKRTCR
uniref:Uncharacterized protein n=1 Tax=Trichogramma kaykai TaxID=54128 RepID=A0ABD2XNC5_9HYME